MRQENKSPYITFLSLAILLGVIWMFPIYTHYIFPCAHIKFELMNVMVIVIFSLFQLLCYYFLLNVIRIFG